jgi:hypothetical protein
LPFYGKAKSLYRQNGTPGQHHSSSNTRIALNHIPLIKFTILLSVEVLNAMDMARPCWRIELLSVALHGGPISNATISRLVERRSLDARLRGLMQ